MQRKEIKKLKYQTRSIQRKKLVKRAERSTLKLEQVKAEQTAAQKATEKAMSDVEEGGQEINNGLKI